MGKSVLSYKGLFDKMEKLGVTKTDLVNNGMHPTTVSKLAKNENVSIDAIMKLCEIFDCQISEIVTFYRTKEDRDSNIVIGNPAAQPDEKPKRRKFDPLTDCNYADNCMTCDLSDICRARYEVCDYYDDCKSCDVRLYCRGSHMHRKPGAIPKKQPGKKVLLDETLLKLLVDRTKK